MAVLHEILYIHLEKTGTFSIQLFLLMLSCQSFDSHIQMSPTKSHATCNGEVITVHNMKLETCANPTWAWYEVHAMNFIISSLSIINLSRHTLICIFDMEDSIMEVKTFDICGWDIWLFKFATTQATLLFIDANNTYML